MGQDYIIRLGIVYYTRNIILLGSTTTNNATLLSALKEGALWDAMLAWERIAQILGLILG